MLEKKYVFSHDDNNGYHLTPENYEIVNMLSTSKERGLVKICIKNNKLYLFFNKEEEKYDLSNRKIDSDKIIYEIKNFTIEEVIERFNIEKKISDSEKNYFFSIVDDYLKKGKKLEFKYENPYFALILSEILNDNVCFEKTSEIFINKRLNTLERCVYNNFNKNTINAYLIYIKEKKITSAISKCLDEKIIYEFLDDCKKDIFKSAKKLGLKEIKQEIFTKDCVELKRNLLKYFINNANEKQINFLYKAMKSKFFILGF